MNNSQARKLGERIKAEIKNSEKPRSDLLCEIQEVRKSFQEGGANIFKSLSDISYRIRNDRIVTFRLKRIETIISKLKREPHMELDRMWDIGGCRCIIESIKAVESLAKDLKSKLKIRKENNYLDGKQNGYRALHLYAECPNTGKIVEIQLRTKQQHNWATLVEIVDLVYNKQLKFGEKDNDFNTFFQLLSNLNTLTFDQKIKLIDIEKKQKLINDICEIFARNFIKVRQNWLKLEEKPGHDYYVIEVDSNRLPTICSYENYSQAEEYYFQRFISADNNVVLTHLINPNFKQICMAYSNYILTSHRFVDDYFKIMSDLLKHLHENKNRALYTQYHKMFKSNYIIEYNALENECRGLVKSVDNKEYHEPKVKEWINEIDQRLKDRKALYDQIDSLNISNGKFAKLIKSIAKKGN
jgi:ppGpp synthetase/RelA/SpoT-type nucleotidyltranferase